MLLCGLADARHVVSADSQMTYSYFICCFFLSHCRPCFFSFGYGLTALAPMLARLLPVMHSTIKSSTALDTCWWWYRRIRCCCMPTLADIIAVCN